MESLELEPEFIYFLGGRTGSPIPITCGTGTQTKTNLTIRLELELEVLHKSKEWLRHWYVQNYLKQGVCHTVTLPFTFKSILRQKKNYENSNISPCKNIYIILKKSSKRNRTPSRYYNSITNLEFQKKPKYHLSKNPHIKIDLMLLPRGE